MTTDRLFVILLVMLIPMTGCFGAIGDADADENDDDDIQMYTVGGVFVHDDYPEVTDGYYIVHTFNTVAGEVVKVHYYDAFGTSSSKIDTVCTDGSYGSGMNYYEEAVEYYLWGSHTDCEHRIRITSWPDNWDNFGFSLVYSIHEATVLQPN